MPRQVPTKKLVSKRSRSKSIVPRRRKRVRTGNVIPKRSPDGGKTDKIGKSVNSLAKAGMIATPDKNTSMKDLSRSIISAIGGGVVTEVAPDSVSQDDIRTKRKVPLNTRYSLKNTQTDRTVIPNDQIKDLKSINKEFAKSPMVSAKTFFPNFEEDTMFSPQPQGQLKEVFHRQQELKRKETSNLIDLMGEIINLQDELKSDMKLSAFKYTKRALANPDVDNSNFEFKDFSDPNLNYDDDFDDIVKN